VTDLFQHQWNWGCREYRKTLGTFVTIPVPIGRQYNALK
jgi:hypothetical protein